MSRKLAEGKKVIVEFDSEGFENVFYRNKVYDFLNAVQKTGLGRDAKFPKGVTASVQVDLPLVETPENPVKITAFDLQRAKELEDMDTKSDTSDLPPFDPFPFDDVTPQESPVVTAKRKK